MPGSSSTSAGTRWSVTSQIEATRPNAMGRYVEGVIVSFVTATGIHGSVFVPNDLYNASTVSDMIAQKAKVLDEVGNLSG